MSLSLNGQCDSPEVVIPLEDFQRYRRDIGLIVATLESDADLAKLAAVQAHLLNLAYAIQRTLFVPDLERGGDDHA